MYDVIIRNGQVIDGTGRERFRADVGIIGERVVQIGDLSGEVASRVIDADGLIVSPGFIDMHSHEQSILVDPRADSKVRQGVTTEVMGNCGISLAPIQNDGAMVATSLLGAFRNKAIEITWSSMSECLDELEGRGVLTNYVTLVGHGTVRASVMGLDDRPPKPDELEAMKAMVTGAMADGAWGLSSGLIYVPAVYSRTEELVELAKVAASAGGIYATHIRGEHDPLLEPAIAEAIEIGSKADIPVEISHFKMFGKDAWGKAEAFLAMLDATRDDGVEVTMDSYPYIASNTTLSVVLPVWMQEGGTVRMVERLRKDELRRKAKEEMSVGNVMFSKGIGWDAVRIVKSRRDESYDDRSIAEIAARQSKDEYETIFDILIAEPGIMAIYFAMCEADVSAILKHPLTRIGSDSYALADHGVLAQGKPHPRCYGTFPRVLGKYSRDEGLFTLEQAVRKMTSTSADKIRLEDRGVLEEGAFADVVAFNPETVIDRATFEDPHQYPVGIDYVIVNGRVVVENGDYTGELAGKVLRHKGEKT